METFFLLPNWASNLGRTATVIGTTVNYVLIGVQLAFYGAAVGVGFRIVGL